MFFSFKPSVVKFWCSWVRVMDNVPTKKDNRIKSCACTSLEWKWKVAKDSSCNVIIIQLHPVRQGRAVNEGPDGTFSEQASFMGHLIQKVLWKVNNCNIYTYVFVAHHNRLILYQQHLCTDYTFSEKTKEWEILWFLHLHSLFSQRQQGNFR